MKAAISVIIVIVCVLLVNADDTLLLETATFRLALVTHALTSRVCDYFHQAKHATLDRTASSYSYTVYTKRDFIVMVDGVATFNNVSLMTRFKPPVLAKCETIKA